MRVDPSSDTPFVAAIRDGTAEAPALWRGTPILSPANELSQALMHAPEARPEKVAQARALVQDASYPPQVLIRKLSELFAIKLVDATFDSINVVTP